MNSLGFSRYALAMGAAAAMLVACAGSQPPIGPGAMLQSRAIAEHADRSGSWMLPEAKNEDLVYIAAGEVYVYAYGTGNLVGTLPRIGDTLYECADKHGDVFITVYQGTSNTGVYEYAHGGTTPINVFPVPGALACAIDPSTGNLAVINGGPTVYIFPKASGSPEMYTDNNIYTTDVAYDDSGNLFVDGFYNGKYGGFALVELLTDSSHFQDITIEGSENSNAENPIFWDGKYLGLGSYQRKGRSDQEIVQRLAISGTTATIAGYTPLGLQREPYHLQFWISGRVAVQASNKPKTFSLIQYFRYPQGQSTKKLKVQNLGAPYGITVSVAPHG